MEGSRMSEFNATLLREKFIIRDVMPERQDDRKPVIALSNRMTLPLSYGTGELIAREDFVVRAQNMHTCTRLAAHIAQDFQDQGPLLSRAPAYDWAAAYEAVTKGHETKFNPNLWAAVYHKGRVVFESGAAERHPFLDIIEQCDSRNKGDYEKSVRVAEDAFKSAGKLVTIEHDANVALLITVTDEEGKCGVIVRGPARTTTFNFTARKRPGRPVRLASCLSAAAAFLEGIQLAFQVGMIHQKIRYDLIAASSEEARKREDAAQKLVRLNSAITQFEALHDVRYRPERPDFKAMVADAEDFARKMLSAEVERKIQSGEMDATGWVM
jgi:hypothetical protein